MGIATLYADGIEAAYRRGLTAPAPQADPDFRTFGFLTSGLSGIPRGAMEVLSSVRDLSAESERQFRESPRGRIVAQEYERRTGVKPADQYRMPGGTSLRQAAEYNLAPDPQTSHVADQVFHGLTRFGTKAVVAVAAAGPVAGAALLGAEETNTAYRDLIGRGIDSETALKVAAVQGAISAAGVVLPVSGAGMAATTAGKVGATAALVGVGGPGAYVAQETMARDILQRAGYADEAGKHDPADPLGLALYTILPAAFGGVALRGALRSTKQIGPIKTEAGVRDAVQLSPEEQAASDAYERSAANLAELRQEIARTKDPALRQILERELATQTEAAAQAGRGAVVESAARSPEVVDAARVKVLQETVTRSLPESPDAYPRLMEALDALAAGERVAVPDVLPPLRSDTAQALDLQIAQLEAQRADLLPAAGQLADRGEVAPIRQELALLQQNAPDATEAGIKAFAKDIQATEGVSYKAALSKAKKQIAGSVADYEAQVKRLEEAIARNAAGQQASEALSRIDQQIIDLQRQRAAVEPFSVVRTPIAEAVRQAIADPLPARTDAPTTPQAANLEAAAPARGAGVDAPPGVPEPGRPAADVQAAGVAAAQQERQIVEALAAERPDMMVTLPGGNEALTLADALEQIKAQQALDESDAGLLRAAVLCDLSP